MESILSEMTMYITKAAQDGKVMKWSAVNSDTDKDLYQERMSIDLYRSFIDGIKKNAPVPEKFKSMVCSDYWQGGMPYLSVSHYPDLNGQAVPGEPVEVYIDGNKLKAKGVLFDSPLGHSVFRSLKDDKLKSPDERIRISIGFIDLSHRHGDGKPFVRESVMDLCPDCLQGVGDKVYLKGYLVHLALTRVPVNQRTEMVLEEKSDMGKKTRKEDAASIVGEPLAEELDLKNKATTQRSDVLIEMSDAIVEESESDMKKKCMKDDGTVDEECMKKMRAAKMKSDVEDVSDDVEDASVEKSDTGVKFPGLDKAVTAAKEPVVEKFDDDQMGAVVNEAPTYVDSLPYGGATSISDAEKYVAAKNEILFVMDAWSVFSNVAWNIFARDDVPDKKSLLTKAVDDFKNVLTAKAMVIFSQTTPVVELSESKSHELQPAIDALLGVIDNSVVLASDGERAEQINPALSELGTAIMGFLNKKSVVDEPPAPDKNTLLEDIKNLIQPLAEKMETLSGEVGMLKAKSTAQTVAVTPRIPAPRTQTISPLVAKSEPKVKPGSLRDIINKSVGLSE